MNVILFILVLYTSYIVYTIIKNKSIGLLFKLILSVSYVYWYIIPYLLTSKDHEWFKIWVNYDDYILYYIYQSIFLIITFQVFRFFNIKKVKLANWFSFNSDFLKDKNLKKIIFYLSILGILISIMNTINSDMLYLRENDISGGVERSLLTALTPFCFLYIYYLLIFERFSLNKFKLILIWSLVLSNVILQILSGSRIILLLPIILITIHYFQTKNNKYIIIASSILFLALTLAPVISVLRSTGSAYTLNDIKSELNGSSKSSKTLDELVIKTNAVFYGIPYLNQHGWGSGGYRVWGNSILSNVPFIDRPVPISDNGEYSGTLARRAGNAFYTTHSDVINVGCSGAESAFWVGGWIAFLISSLFGGIMLWVSNKWLVSSSWFAIILGMSILKFPICSIEIGTGMMFRDIPRFFLYYLIIYLIYLVVKKR